jgi:hypothetical protein
MRRTILALAALATLGGCANGYVAGDIGPGRPLASSTQP